MVMLETKYRYGTYSELQEAVCNSKSKQYIVLQEENINQTKADDSSTLEARIYRLVYELYCLTNSEVKVIDPNETTVGSDDDLFKA